MLVRAGLKCSHIESTSEPACGSPNFVEIDVHEQNKGFANFELYVSFGIQKKFLRIATRKQRVF